MGHGFEILEWIFGRAGLIGGGSLDGGFGAFDVEVFERRRLERGEDIGGRVASVERKVVTLYLLASAPKSVYMSDAKVPRAEAMMVVLGLL